MPLGMALLTTALQLLAVQVPISTLEAVQSMVLLHLALSIVLE
jgi:hypothetical protein